MELFYVLRPNIFLNICQGTNIGNIDFTCYVPICARNKYGYQVVHICHVCDILNRPVREIYVHICATYEVASVNYGTMRPVYRRE